MQRRISRNTKHDSRNINITHQHLRTQAIISIFSIEGNYSEASDKDMIEESVTCFKWLTFTLKITKKTI